MCAQLLTRQTENTIDYRYFCTVSSEYTMSANGHDGDGGDGEFCSGPLRQRQFGAGQGGGRAGAQRVLPHCSAARPRPRPRPGPDPRHGLDTRWRLRHWQLQHWYLVTYLYLVAHSATQYMSLCVCLSVRVSHGFNFVFPIASKGFPMVL